MARAATSRRRNFPGLNWLTRKQVTYKRSRGESSHSSQAYRAGVKSGDTDGFGSWLNAKGLDRASRSVQKSLEAQYRRGVDRAGVAERVKSAKSERMAKKKAAPKSLSSYKGIRLYKAGGGEYTTSIDKESRFDSLQDAKDFIKSWKENPCARTVKSKVSDRAQRYRANQPGCKPAGLKRCKLCKSRRFLTVDHKDGDESNGRKSNLRWLCKSCNTRLGAAFAREGLGRRTVQQNLTKEGGASNVYEYALAGQMHDQVRSHHAHDEGGLIIHRTPKAKRREFASEIWGSRYAHGTDRPGSGSAGFDEPNPERSTEYRLGYNLGQMDRQTAVLPKTWAELAATFDANFPGGTRISALPFFQAYEDGYNALAGGTPARNGRGHVNRGLSQRNPSGDSEEYEQARKIAELFHGRPVKEEITVTEQIREHDWLWRIGPLVSLKIRTVTKRNATLPFHQTEEGMVHLFCSPDGRQFYLRGGDQELDLKALDMGEGTEWYRDHMLIGEAKEITYRDKKKFHRFKLVDYFHRLGEVTKKKPMLAYDAFAHKMQIVGGQYKVETDDLVDGMSPGIVN